MKTLVMMTSVQFKMLLRNKALIISSIGLAVVSMLIFGTLFGDDNAKPAKVGVVDLDKSLVSQQAIVALQSNRALTIITGEQASLNEDLKKGNAAAVVVLQPGFGENLPKGTAHIRLYVDQSDLIGAARTRGTVLGVFDAMSKAAAGFKNQVQVEEPSVTVHSQREIDLLTPGMIGLTVMFANMFVGVALIAWRERGTLKRLSATPLKSSQLIISQIIGQFALSFVQVAIILGLAKLLFNVEVEASWLPTIALLIIAGTFSIISLGYVVGNFVKRQQAVQSTVTLIALPMMFLGGSYFPVDPPVFLKPLVEILPLTHLNRALRKVMVEGGDFNSVVADMLVLVAFGIVLLALSIRSFRWSN